MTRWWRIRGTLGLVSALVLLATACGRSVSNNNNPSPSGTVHLTATTSAGTKPVDTITWGTYREISSLDPIYAFDYPENTILSILCETLLHQNPDGTITPGLASLSYTDPTHLVFTLKPGITFWDGNPLTPEDVVYSLERNTDTSLGGFYGAVFSRVQSIDATGPNEVTITLTQPDYWLPGELASTPGWIVEKSYVESKGKDFGTPSGLTMCTGSYKVGSWKPGDVFIAVRNDNYWNPDVHPLVREIDFKPAPDEAALTSALLNGGVNGYFGFAISTLPQLQQSNAVTVTDGYGWNSDDLIVSSFKGVLGDVRVRQALSMALDRQGLIDTVYKGSAVMPKAFTGPGTWGYGTSVFQQAWNALPDLAQNVDEAKKLVQEAGASGQTITLGMSSELNNIATAASAYQSAAESIGLHVKLKSVSAQNYINFFIDPKVRADVDGFFTVNYGDYADPAALLASFVLPDGSQNYSGYDNPQVTQLLEAARSEADPDKRAQDVANAQKIIMQELPWIPDALPNSELITSSNLTGATASFAYMFAPWANDLGGT
jgi:peptide/nickel transport system substrate-binding protein